MARRITSQLLTGALIVLIGLLLLVDTTELYDVSELFVYVPVLFVLLGVYALIAGGLRNVVGPVAVILVAGAWQLVALDLVTTEEIVRFWPLLVVLFGLGLLFGPLRRRRRPETASEVGAFAVFGGSEKRVRSDRFTGGELTALFGGVEIDLRDAEIADPPARISVLAMFGGIELRVPEEWEVELDVLPILGGVADERPRPPADAEPREGVDLRIDGFVAFGGVSVN